MIGRGRYGWWGWALREVAIDGVAGGEFFENRAAFVFGIIPKNEEAGDTCPRWGFYLFASCD